MARGRRRAEDLPGRSDAVRRPDGPDHRVAAGLAAALAESAASCSGNMAAVAPRRRDLASGIGGGLFKLGEFAIAKRSQRAPARSSPHGPRAPDERAARGLRRSRSTVGVPDGCASARSASITSRTARAQELVFQRSDGRARRCASFWPAAFGNRRLVPQRLHVTPHRPSWPRPALAPRADQPVRAHRPGTRAAPSASNAAGVVGARCAIGRGCKSSRWRAGLTFGGQFMPLKLGCQLAASAW